MINASSEFVKAMLSPQKRLHIKIEIFDSNMTYLREITQQVKSDLGTLAINGDSPIRRSFRLTLDNSLGEFIFGENNLIWIDKRIKLYAGLQTWSGNIEYVPMGLFVLTEPEDEHSLNGKPTTINAVDKAYFMTDKRGKFINEQIIQTGAKISDAIRTIASHVGETMFNFDNITDTVPYELTYSGTDNRWNAIQELATLAKCTIFYDVDGRLRLKRINLDEFENESVTWSYIYGDPKEKLYAGNVRRFNDSNLYNVEVGGDDGVAESQLDCGVVVRVFNSLDERTESVVCNRWIGRVDYDGCPHIDVLPRRATANANSPMCLIFDSFQLSICPRMWGHQGAEA